MAQQSFSATVETFVLKSKVIMLDVFQRSSTLMFEDVLARTPRDTGFLANTLDASLDGPQPIRADARPPSDAGKDSYPVPTEYSLVISNATIGSTVWGSFSAAYARPVEFGTKHQFPAAMIRLAAQAWPFHVAQAVREAKAAVASQSPGSTPPTG